MRIAAAAGTTPPGVEKDENCVKGLANYNNLTIRISKLMILRQNSNNGKGDLFVVKSDEIPGCAAHGLTISEALNNFQKTAELWLKWFDDSRP